MPEEAIVNDEFDLKFAKNTTNIERKINIKAKLQIIATVTRGVGTASFNENASVIF